MASRGRGLRASGVNDELRPGDPARLGGYELLGRLGDGGMGSVFLARSPQGRRVAVKVVRPELSHDDVFRARFRSEVNRAHQPCLGVKIDSAGHASLVGAECDPTDAPPPRPGCPDRERQTGPALFGLSREGRDDKGRASYSIVSERYGVVQWSPSQKKIYVELLGDAPIGTTFSLVDRGAA